MNVRRSSRMRRGGALVEMVIATPLLLLVLVGLVEAGRAGELAVIVANAARAGVQYGAVSANDTTGMQTAAINDANTSAVTAVASTYCRCADITGVPTATVCSGSNCSSTHQIVYVKVVATGQTPSLFNYSKLPASLRNISITSTAVMRVP